jgi:hypothetical protein
MLDITGPANGLSPPCAVDRSVEEGRLGGMRRVHGRSPRAVVRTRQPVYVWSGVIHGHLSGAVAG